MKRLHLLIILLLVVPLAFFGGIYFNGMRAFNLAAYLEASHADEGRKIRRTIYGSNRLHSAAYSPDVAEQLSAFDPRSAKCFLRLSYVGGYRDVRENSLELKGDGTFHATVDGRSRLLTTLQDEQTREIFVRLVSSGLMNYEEGTVQLKQELMRPSALYSSTGDAVMKLTIHVPQLSAEKIIEIYALDSVAKTFPDIIEYQLILDFEKTMTDLVPAGVNYWE